MADDNVVPLFTANQLAPDFELQAQFLEQLAKELREQQHVYDRCLLIRQPRSGAIEALPFGGPMTSLDLVGMIEFAKFQVMLNFHDR